METFRGSPFKNLPEKRVLTISHRLPCEVRTEFDSGTKCLQSSHSFLILPPVQPVPKIDRFYPRKHFSPVRRLCDHRSHIPLSNLYHIKPFSCIVTDATVDMQCLLLVIPSRASVSSIGTLRLSNMWIIGASARICAMRRDRPLCQSRI